MSQSVMPSAADDEHGHPTAVDFRGLRSCTPRMLHLFETARLVAGLDTPVLIEGETGTGKTVLAQAIHAASPQHDKPFVTIDCGSIPESLAESELFGHERGAFTGADRAYAGRIQAAAGGTLFVDEINSLSLAMQAKLLRFLEDHEFTRIGQQRPIGIKVRLVSASNVPLENLVSSGRMRADFYYRINVIRLEVPPLRERPDDLPLLVEQFLAEDSLARRFGVHAVAPDVMAALRVRAWPGNLRELLNVLRRSVVTGSDRGLLRRLDEAGGEIAPARVDTSGAAVPAPATFRTWMRAREQEYFDELVRRFPTVSRQAAASGLPERTLYRKLRELRLEPAPHDRRRAAALHRVDGPVATPYPIDISTTPSGAPAAAQVRARCSLGPSLR